MNKPTYLVTGGCGFIGSMVCKKLVEQGRRVVVLDNLANGNRDLVLGLGGEVNLIESDIRNAGEVAKVIAQVRPHAVCHLAAIHFIPYCIAHPQEALETNVVGTLNVLEACRSYPPAMVALASTAAVYAPSDDLHRENDAIEPIDIYGMTKRACEDLGKIYAAQTGAGCIAARIFNAVGPNETNPHFIPALIDQLRAGKREVHLGNLGPSRDYISTPDLALGLIALMDHKINGFDTFNLGTGKGYTVQRVVEMCEEILQCPIKVTQRADLVRKVERMSLRAGVDKVHNATHWKAQINLEETLRELLLAPPSGQAKSGN